MRPKIEAGYRRWIEHYENRLAYERAMLNEGGGLIAEQQEIQVGGRVLVRGEWVRVLRVNRKDGVVCSVRTTRRYVPVVSAENIRGYEAPTAEEAQQIQDAMKKAPLCNYPGERFATCTQAEWDAIHKDYRGSETREATESTGAHRVRVAIGYRLHLPEPLPTDSPVAANRTHNYWPVFITDAKRKDPPAKAPTPSPASSSLFVNEPDPAAIQQREERRADSLRVDPLAASIQQMQATLREGVKVVAAPQLFPTPAELAARMVEEADIEATQDVLEPSAGTGVICKAILESEPNAKLFAVEVNPSLCELLSQTITPREDAAQGICRNVLQGDFLEQNGNLGTFDRVLMNPPFQDGADIKHIQHAVHMLKPGGRLVAICANGPRQQAILKPLAENSGGWWEDLPAGTFASQGTNVNSALLVIEG